MKFLKKLLKISICLFIFLTAFYFLYLSPRYTVPILMYHRFGYEESSLFVEPENFACQMAYLKDKNYNVISLDELVKGIKSNRNFAHNSVVITIDDGYKDNYTYGYPVLKKHNFPATIFIIANFMGNKKGYLTWEEIKVMSEQGISFGGHTKNEVYIPSIKEKQILWDETAGCK
ncbi:MAG: polysaccharide deacetylase family protein, partial [Candidatus Omnitrophica bacterium]|nr:polysaccharide deacetylase family protein [Candidatus Omnitrophota bacterium]